MTHDRTGNCGAAGAILVAVVLSSAWLGGAVSDAVADEPVRSQDAQPVTAANPPGRLAAPTLLSVEVIPDAADSGVRPASRQWSGAAAAVVDEPGRATERP